MAENNNALIPEHADKILFAEDLIGYVMLRNIGLNYAGWRAVHCRELIYNAFDEETKLAVGFLGSAMEMEHYDIFHYLLSENAVNVVIYMKIADERGKKYFCDGFEANKFLHYCVLLASMAAYFFTNGILEAPDIGVMCIANAIQDIDMMTGGWEALKRSVQRYASMAQDSMDRLSPTSMNSDEDSEEVDFENEPQLAADVRVAN